MSKVYRDAGVVNLEDVRKAFELLGFDLSECWDDGLVAELHAYPRRVELVRYQTDEKGNKFVHKDDPNHPRYGEVAIEKSQVAVAVHETPTE